MHNMGSFHFRDLHFDQLPPVPLEYAQFWQTNPKGMELSLSCIGSQNEGHLAHKGHDARFLKLAWPGHHLCKNTKGPSVSPE